MPLTVSLVLKASLLIFAALFLMNWVSIVSAQKIRGFRWGDFLLVFLAGLLVFSRLDTLKDFGRFLPDTIDALALEPRQQFSSFQNRIKESKTTVRLFYNYLLGLVQKDLNSRLRYTPPAPSP